MTLTSEKNCSRVILLAHKDEISLETLRNGSKNVVTLTMPFLEITKQLEKFGSKVFFLMLIREAARLK